MKTTITAFALLPSLAFGSFSHVHYGHRHLARDVNSCQVKFNDYWSNCINVERRTDCMDLTTFTAQRCGSDTPGNDTSSVVASSSAVIPSSTTAAVVAQPTPGGGGGKTGSGRATYHQDFSSTACNLPASLNGGLVTAINGVMFTAGGNPNLDPICGSFLTVTATGTGKSVTVQIIDKCGCQGAIGVDLSSSAMIALTGVADGAVDITWELHSK